MAQDDMYRGSVGSFAWGFHDVPRCQCTCTPMLFLSHDLVFRAEFKEEFRHIHQSLTFEQEKVFRLL
jgi:hypothetical protein